MLVPAGSSQLRCRNDLSIKKKEHAAPNPPLPDTIIEYADRNSGKVQ